MHMDREITPVARYKAAQKSRGRAQVLVWMPTDLRDDLDQVVAGKGYKNRSQAIEELLRTAISMKGSSA